MFSMPPSAVSFISETLSAIAPRARALECAVIDILVENKYIDPLSYVDLVTGREVPQYPSTPLDQVDFFRDTISGACIASAVNTLQNRVEDVLLSYGFINERSQPLVAAREPQPHKKCLLITPEKVPDWNIGLAGKIQMAKDLLRYLGIEYEERKFTAAENPYKKFARTTPGSREFPFVFVESIPPAVYGTKQQHELRHLPLRVLDKCEMYSTAPAEIQAKWEDSYLNFFSGVRKTHTFKLKSIEGYKGPKFSEAFIKRLYA